MIINTISEHVPPATANCDPQ